MNRGKLFPMLAGLGSVSGLAFLVLTAAGEGPPLNPPKLNPALRIPRGADIRKSVIEMPLKGALARQTAPAAPAAVTTRGFVNPRVEPGKVRWHANFKAACAAAANSKKPVLLFQMMGRLDEKFC